MTDYNYSMKSAKSRWSARCLDCDWHWPNKNTKANPKQSPALQSRGTARHHGAHFGHRVESMQVRCFVPEIASKDDRSFRCHIAPHGRHVAISREGKVILADSTGLHSECRHCSWLISRAHTRTGRWFAAEPLDVRCRKSGAA